jgi:hypothetical protein
MLQDHLEPISLAPILSRAETRLIDFVAHDLQDICVEAMCKISTSSWTHGRLRWIGDGIVDLITSITHVSKNSVGLLDQIDLEPNVIDNIGTFPWNRNDGNQVDEWDTTSAVIDQRCLAFFTGVEHSLQVCHGDIVRVLSLRSLYDFSVRRWRSAHTPASSRRHTLKETTIAA